MSDSNNGSFKRTSTKNTFFNPSHPQHTTTLIAPLLQQQQNIKWSNPLPDTASFSIPIGKTQQGAFGSRKQHQYCSGVEIQCETNQRVCAVEDGKVVRIFDYSKQQNSWVNKTRVIMVEGLSGVVCYCNLQEDKTLVEGQEIKKGTCIGYTVPIYKDKSSTKIRIELYVKNIRKRLNWYFTKPKPKQLLDPTQYLLSTIAYHSRSK